jgi:hypothetical protein
MTKPATDYPITEGQTHSISNFPTLQEAIQTRGFLWDLIIGILKNRFNNNISQAFITFIAMISGYLGQGMSLFIGHESHVDGRGFLRKIREMIPCQAIVESPDLNINIDPNYASVYHNKTVVAHAPDGPKKNINRLCTLMGEGDIGLVVLVGPKEPKHLYNVQALRITIDADQVVVGNVKEAANNDLKIKSAIRRLFLELMRLERKNVEIPFWEKIVMAMNTGDAESAYKLSIIKKCLTIIALIRNIRILTPEEAFIKFNNLDIDKYLPTLANGCPSYSAELVCSAEDYKIFYMFGNEIFRNDIDAVSEAERSVFEAVKRINFNGMRGVCHINPDKTSEKEIIKKLNAMTYPMYTEIWASVAHIKEEIIIFEQKTFSNSQINVGLGGLEDKQCVAKRNDGVKTGEYFYRIATLSLGKRTILPHPSKISGEGNDDCCGLLPMEDTDK